MDLHPFARTSVIITGIIASLLLVLGLVGIVSFVPDAGPRISSILTITIPLFLTSMIGIGLSIRTGKIAAQNNQKLNTVVKHTNGINTRLLDAALGSNPLTTAEIQIIQEEIKSAQATQEGR